MQDYPILKPQTFWYSLSSQNTYGWQSRYLITRSFFSYLYKPPPLNENRVHSIPSTYNGCIILTFRNHNDITLVVVIDIAGRELFPASVCNSSNCKRSQAKSIFFPDVVYQHKKYPIRPISGSGLLLVSSEMSCVRPITQLCRLDTKSARS